MLMLSNAHTGHEHCKNVVEDRESQIGGGGELLDRHTAEALTVIGAAAGWEAKEKAWSDTQECWREIPVGLLLLISTALFELKLANAVGRRIRLACDDARRQASRQSRIRLRTRYFRPLPCAVVQRPSFAGRVGFRGVVINS